MYSTSARDFREIFLQQNSKSAATATLAKTNFHQHFTEGQLRGSSSLLCPHFRFQAQRNNPIFWSFHVCGYIINNLLEQ